MKVLLVGGWHGDVHEGPLSRAFERAGHQTVGASWSEGLHSPIDRVQNRFLVGPWFAQLGRRLVAAAQNAQPDLILVYGASHVTAAMVRGFRAAARGAVVVAYCNDDPFSPGAGIRWRWLRRAVPEYDFVLAYRPHNVQDFIAAGARRVHVWLPWFLPERHRALPLTEAERERYESDVAFIGHYEDDGRLEMLEAIAQTGVRLKIFGHPEQWNRHLTRSRVLARHAPVQPVWGDDYARALTGARIALVFLSTLNRDRYTRRCFEIPAVGTLMLAPRTRELEGLFQPGVEADYFSDAAELCERVQHYLADEDHRRRVALAGHRRVFRDGHDIDSRVQMLLSWVTAQKVACAS